MRKFDATKVTQDLIVWIRKYFEDNAKPTDKAICAISGGKDSSIVAALCVAALGVERVYGVMLPNGVQSDINYSQKLIDFLGIESTTINIKNAVDALKKEISDSGIELTAQLTTNLPARIRMATVYGVAASIGGRVANTCNLSETMLGWETRWGDAVGDFAPLAKLTVQEVKAVGKQLGLPEDLIEKTPTDGLCGKSDEDSFGFTYETLDDYLRHGKCDDKSIKAKIDTMIKNSEFKRLPIPFFNV